MHCGMRLSTVRTAVHATPALNQGKDATRCISASNVGPQLKFLRERIKVLTVSHDDVVRSSLHLSSKALDLNYVISISFYQECNEKRYK